VRVRLQFKIIGGLLAMAAFSVGFGARVLVMSAEAPEARLPAPGPTSSEPHRTPELRGVHSSPVSKPESAPKELVRAPSEHGEVVAARSDVCLDPWTEDLWRYTFDAFAASGQEEQFRRMYDAIAVRPIGRALARYYEDTRDTHDPGYLLAEGVAAAQKRISDLNRRHPGALNSGRFAAFIWRDGAALDSVVGTAAPGEVLGADMLAQVTAVEMGLDWARLDVRGRDEATRVAYDWLVRAEELRREMWKTAHAVYQGFPMERVLAALIRGTGQIVVVREGEHPQIEERLARVAQLEREVVRLIEDEGK